MHYMYGVAVIPKVAFNLFGMFLDAFRIETLRVNSDIANSYIPLSNNIANVVVFVFLLSKRRLTVRSDIIYFSMIGSIIMATALILQCRYFYFVYVLLCLQAAQTGTSETTKVGPIHG